MLPLWIIDITEKSVRQDAFVHLVEQIDHVQVNKKQSVVNSAIQNHQGEYNDNVDSSNAIQSHSSLKNINTTSSPETEEEIEEQEKREALRKARIVGNYWSYNSYCLEDYFDRNEIDNAGDISVIAEKLYQFQEKLIDDAMKFILSLRSTNVKPFQTINIVVLGDASELFTQMLFPSLATILQKEKGRFLAGHVHQGMDIKGMLYIPCNVNNYHVDKRVKILRLMKEIDVQHNLAAIRGYDNVMLYQDVQNRTECTYLRLDQEEQAQYLVQCLVHLFLACDITHPLLNGTGSDDIFYFSMGASSVYFDMSVEDKIDANSVAEGTLNAFKDNGERSNTDVDVKLYDKEMYRSVNFVGKFKVDDIDLDKGVDKKAPFPHPITDFIHRNLKRVYYQYYLRYFPADLLRETMQEIEESTNSQLDQISIHSSSLYRTMTQSLPFAIKEIISKVNKDGGGLPFLETKFKEMQEYISKEKANIQRSIESIYWLNIISRKKNSSFEDYHDTYTNDINLKNSGSGCHTMKQEVLLRLKDMLSKEKTLMATLVRSFFMGIICVLSLFPIVDFLSQNTIDLGDVRENAFFWAVGFFMLPLFIQLIQFLLYLRKRRNVINILKIYYTHDAYARIANRIESDALSFYNNVLELINEYLERCDKIRKEVNIIYPGPNQKMLFPTSKFNQPLNGGEFNNESLIPKAEIERCYVRVNTRPVLVNNISQEEYFILINSFRDEFADLFNGVEIVDSYTKRFDETENDYVLVSRETILKEKEQKWQDTKSTFLSKLFARIQKNMLPREFPTIGDKLIHYRNKTERFDLLEYMVAYAATNGELSSQTETEYADIKINRDIENLLLPYLPLYTTTVQCSKYDEIFQRYIFVTRWCVYDSIALNRLLPKEDFDEATRVERVYSAEEILRKKKELEYNTLFGNANIQLQEEEKDPHQSEVVAKQSQEEEKEQDYSEPVMEQFEEGEQKYERNLSSLILWAVCPDDNSSEWFKLFEMEHFSTAYQERIEFRKTLNQND